MFWYSGCPTYAPKRLSFSLYELGDDGEIETLVYESRIYGIATDMKVRKTVMMPKMFILRPDSMYEQMETFDTTSNINVSRGLALEFV